MKAPGATSVPAMDLTVAQASIAAVGAVPAVMDPVSCRERTETTASAARRRAEGVRGMLARTPDGGRVKASIVSTGEVPKGDAAP